MPLTLKRLLYWMSILGGLYLTASLIDYFWPVNPTKPLEQKVLGDAVFGFKFLLSVSAYLLVRNEKIKAALGVVAILIVFSFLYGLSILLFDRAPLFPIVIFAGELFVCGLLAYYSLAEARSHGLLKPAPKHPSA